MTEAAAQKGALPICQKSQERHSARVEGLRVEHAELFRQVHQDGAGFEHPGRVGVLRSSRAGIFEFGLMATNPLLNC